MIPEHTCRHHPRRRRPFPLHICGGRIFDKKETCFHIPLSVTPIMDRGRRNAQFLSSHRYYSEVKHSFQMNLYAHLFCIFSFPPIYCYVCFLNNNKHVDFVFHNKFEARFVPISSLHSQRQLLSITSYRICCSEIYAKKHSHLC